jgi:hypothetical protein
MRIRFTLLSKDWSGQFQSPAIFPCQKQRQIMKRAKRSTSIPLQDKSQVPDMKAGVKLTIQTLYQATTTAS